MTSIGTSNFAAPRATVADETSWNGSGIIERKRFVRVRGVVDDGVRALRGMGDFPLNVTR
jgi:hypothetical protein